MTEAEVPSHPIEHYEPSTDAEITDLVRWTELTAGMALYVADVPEPVVTYHVGWFVNDGGQLSVGAFVDEAAALRWTNANEVGQPFRLERWLAASPWRYMPAARTPLHG